MYVLYQLLCQICPGNMHQLTQPIQVKVAFILNNANWVSLTEYLYGSDLRKQLK